jgi:cell division protein FtsL
MAQETKSTSTTEFKLTAEWIYYLVFLFVLSLLYIYLSHYTDNIVRDIETTKKNLTELRAENITLKSEIMKNRSRENLEIRLAERGVKEPNRAVHVIRKTDVD